MKDSWNLQMTVLIPELVLLQTGKARLSRKQDRQLRGDENSL